MFRHALIRPGLLAAVRRLALARGARWYVGHIGAHRTVRSLSNEELLGLLDLG
jgi:hypothetical protein